MHLHHILVRGCGEAVQHKQLSLCCWAFKCLVFCSTLVAQSQVTKTPGAECWQLYLVDWGYNTPAERQAAAANPRVTVIDRPGFRELMCGVTV